MVRFPSVSGKKAASLEQRHVVCGVNLEKASPAQTSFLGMNILVKTSKRCVLKERSRGSDMRS